LLEALRDGPLTATQAGVLIDASPTTCSFHLRQLAHFGFVADAGGGKGRSRPWRLLTESWRAPARPGDPEFTRAAQVLDHITLHLTSAELRELDEGYRTLIAEYRERYADRAADPQARPRGTKPVEVYFAAYPIESGGVQ
jgi:predicted ArsR family transcriptional regulator